MLLDSDVLIDLERDHPAANAWFDTLTEPPHVPGIAAMELIAGCRDAEELRAVGAFLHPLTILWPNEEDMSRAMEEYLPLRLAYGIGILDTLIAATAVGAGLPLMTFNIRHFQVIPDLVIAQPYER